MTGDAIFVQGHSHTICQDYAIAEVAKYMSQDYGAAIVCDGCSASPKSEVGASILAHTFLAAYRHNRHGDIYSKFEGNDRLFQTFVKMRVLKSVRTIMRETDLSDNAFDATIVAAISDP